MINYHLIANSVDFYEKLGYARIEAPWWVSKEILNITKPSDTGPDFYIPENKKCLVASGEQGLLYTANKGRLPKGRYLTVTPCFRNESIGILSKKCFIKTELMITDDVSEASFYKIMNDALTYFKTVVPDPKLLTMQSSDDKTHLNMDILYDGIEIGSYGIRSCEFLDWVYGTGCAEPRLSRAIEISRRNR